MSKGAQPVFIKGSAKVWWVVLGCLLGLQLIKHFLTFWLGPVPICYDAVQYLDFGKSVASGDLLLFSQYVSYRVPGYGWFVGFFLWAFDNYALMAVVIAQHLLVMFTAVVPAIICYRMTGRFSACVLAYAISVGGVSRAWFANVLLTDSLFTFFLALLWWAWHEYTRAPTARASLWLGSALGLATLVRPVPQLFWVPLFLSMALVAYSQRPKVRPSKWLAHCAIVGCALVIAVTPWCIRNQIMFGKPFVAKLPAVNKWLVCFQAGAGANLPLPDDESTRRLVVILNESNHDLSDRYCYSVIGTLEHYGLSEHEIDDLVNNVCRAAILEHPVQFGFAMFKRCVNLWRCLRNEHPAFGAGQSPNFGDQIWWRSDTAARIYEPLLRNALSRSLRFNEFVALIVAIGSWWLVRDVRTRAFGVGLVLAFLYFTTITAAVEVENYRYRMTLEPAMIVAIVGGAYVRFTSKPPNDQSELADDSR